MEFMNWLHYGAVVIIVMAGIYIYQNKKNG